MLIIAVIGFGSVCMPKVALAECSPSLQDCPENYYNSKTCRMGLVGNWGYECKPCSSVYLGHVHLPWSTGGPVTIDACYIKLSCSNLNPGRDWMCSLYHNGRNFCTVSNTDDTPVEAHLEYINYGSFSAPGCVLNTKNCSEFDINETYTFSFASGNFAKSDQQGTANWDTSTYTWNVNNCILQHSGLNITQYNRDCSGTVWRVGASISGNAATEYTINYSNGVNWYYCTQCNAGKEPQIFSISDAYDYGCIRYESDSAYIACACSDVEVGFFSTGCQIAYPLNTLAIPNSCHQSCQNGLTTLQVGATSSDACVPDPGQRYCDATGCFSLGTNSNVCN